MDEFQRVTRRLVMWAVAALSALALWAPTTAQAEVPADVVTRPGARGAVTMNYPSRFEPAAEQLDEQAIKSLSKLRYQLSLESIEGVDVWLVSNLDDYFTWKEVRGRAPEWAIGLSLVDRKTVLVRHGLGPNRQLVNIHDTFAHELAHVAIDVARQGRPVPRWFNEGVRQLARRRVDARAQRDGGASGGQRGR